MSEPSANNLLAFLFAERALLDRNTGRHTLVGIFDGITLEREGKVGPWFVFVSTLGEVIFPTQTPRITLSILRQGEEQVLLEADSTVSAEGEWVKSLHVNLAIPIPSMEIAEGEYGVSILVNSELIATRKLIVNKGVVENDDTN